MNISKEKLFANVEKHRDLILSAERYIWNNPETGYREWKTDAYMAKQFEALGYELVKAKDIPGFYTDIDTGRAGPKVLVMGELDSLICENHPECDKETFAVHACGHNAQCAALVGIAAVLKEPGMLDGLSGSVRLMAVPAEELIEIGYREGLRQSGVISYFGGKVEFMKRGYMDGVDLALMVHTTSDLEPGALAFSKGSNGCVTKNVVFKGFSSHAGGAPHRGINALYAASQAFSAINALRETFKESDTTRVHPIITKGGNAVNAIPDDVRVESYVRGSSLDAIIDVNKKVNRALAASAASLGAGVVIHDRPGYTPLNNDVDFLKTAELAIVETVGVDKTFARYEKWDTGCTDMGDVSAVIPAIHPYCGGAKGASHGSEYYITDPEAACLVSAKFQVLLVAMLLKEDAARAKKIVENFTPAYASKEAFFEAISVLDQDKDAVIYNEDGTVTLDFSKRPHQ